MASKEPPRKHKPTKVRPIASKPRSKGQPVRQGHSGPREAVGRASYPKVSWAQMMPGKGLNSVLTVRQGVITKTNGDGSIVVSPDDDPGTAILMEDPRG